MMEYKDGEVIVATPCEHVFHKRCCQEWFQLSRTCPVCRTDVPEALDTGAALGNEESRSISITGPDELRDDNDGSRENTASGRNENQQISNFIRYIRRERRRPPRNTSNRNGGNSIGELSSAASETSYSNRDGNQRIHIERNV